MATLKNIGSLGGPTITMIYDDSAKRLVEISGENQSNQTLRLKISSPIEIIKTLNNGETFDDILTAQTRMSYTIEKVIDGDGKETELIKGILWHATLGD
jgi:hypothetical protein